MTAADPTGHPGADFDVTDEPVAVYHVVEGGVVAREGVPPMLIGDDVIDVEICGVVS